MGEGFLAQVTQLVLKVLVVAEPAAQGSLGDAGLASGGGDRASFEQGDEGAFLDRGQKVVIGLDGEGSFGAIWQGLAGFSSVFRDMEAGTAITCC